MKKGIAWFVGMILLVLKLTGEISLSWWLVAIPFCIAFAQIFIMILFSLIMLMFWIAGE